MMNVGAVERSATQFLKYYRQYFTVSNEFIWKSEILNLPALRAAIFEMFLVPVKEAPGMQCE
jgi:hypothetical protein